MDRRRWSLFIYFIIVYSFTEQRGLSLNNLLKKTDKTGNVDHKEKHARRARTAQNVFHVSIKIAFSCRFALLFVCLEFPPSVPRFCWIITISLGVQFLSGQSHSVYRVAKKNGASLSHCKYYENSMTELRGNWWTSAIFMLNTVINLFV